MVIPPFEPRTLEIDPACVRGRSPPSFGLKHVRPFVMGAFAMNRDYPDAPIYRQLYAPRIRDRRGRSARLLESEHPAMSDVSLPCSCGTSPTCRALDRMSAFGGKADIGCARIGCHLASFFYFFNFSWANFDHALGQYRDPRRRLPGGRGGRGEIDPWWREREALGVVPGRGRHREANNYSLL